jgi:hypothetical protein
MNGPAPRLIQAIRCGESVGNTFWLISIPARRKQAAGSRAGVCFR